jgi:hypothetical protein
MHRDRESIKPARTQAMTPVGFNCYLVEEMAQSVRFRNRPARKLNEEVR